MGMRQTGIIFKDADDNLIELLLDGKDVWIDIDGSNVFCFQSEEDIDKFKDAALKLLNTGKDTQ